MIALRGLDAGLRPYAEWAMDIAHHYGVEPTVTSVYRSWSEQERLRQRFLAGQSRWPANKPGDSAHNYGWAWDSVVPAQQQQLWDQIRRYVGWEVLENDIIHAQVPGWRKYRTSATRRNTG